MVANLFDPSYYRAANPDLAGYSDAQLTNHFQTYGLNEGRQFSPIADLNTYRASNPDLQGFSNRDLFTHLQVLGVAEGRHFSSFVDLNFYRLANADLVRLNNEQLLVHLQTYGLDEQREISADFSPEYYSQRYADLAGLTTPRLALTHLTIYGLDEGRSFSPFVDLNYYRANNADLSSYTPRQALLHLEQYGFNEGRDFSPFFNLNDYRSAYPDLAAAGLNGRRLFDHYEYYGYSEGRAGRNDRAGNSLGTAAPLPLSTTSNLYFDSLTPTDQQDYYRFTVSTAGVLALVAISPSQNGVFGEFLDGNGTVLESGNYTTNPDSEGDVVRFLQPGTYYLRLTALNFDPSTFGTSYALVFALSQG